MQYPSNDNPGDPWSSPALHDLPTLPYPAIPSHPGRSLSAKARRVQVALVCGSLIVALLCGLYVVWGHMAHSPASSVASTSSRSVSGNVAVVASAASTNSPGVIVSPTPTATPSTHVTGAAPVTVPTATPTSAQPTPTVAPSPANVPPTPSPPTPTPTPSCQRVNNNPWCYNFQPGSLISSPPSAFCNYFSCAPGFWSEHGTVEECQDGLYSLNGGVAGDCSQDGGEWRPLYSH